NCNNFSHSIASFPYCFTPCLSFPDNADKLSILSCVPSHQSSAPAAVSLHEVSGSAPPPSGISWPFPPGSLPPQDALPGKSPALLPLPVLECSSDSGHLLRCKSIVRCSIHSRSDIVLE